MSEIDICGKNDPLYGLAASLFIRSKRLSASYIQRYFRISYRRAELLVGATQESIQETANSANKTGEENV